MQLDNESDLTIDCTIKNETSGDVEFQGPIAAREPEPVPLSTDFTYTVEARADGVKPAVPTRNVKAEAKLTLMIIGGQIQIHSS